MKDSERLTSETLPTAGKPFTTLAETASQPPRLTMDQARRIVALLKLGQVKR